MVGTRGIRLGILFLFALAGTAGADVPVTSYDCAPGTPVKGVGCACPKYHSDGKSYSAKRDPADEGKAICVGSASSATRPVPPRPPGGGSYDKLVMDANDAADAYNCTKAEDLYQKALKANPRGLEALVGSGNCMAKQSKWTNAHARFDKALSINAKYEPALWGKAEAYRLAYKKDDAIAAYRQYLDVYPNAYKAKQALDKLQPSGSTTRPVVEAPPPVVGTRGRFPSRTQDVTIAISGTRILANGVEVTGNSQVSDWIGIYGKPDRVWDTKQGVNKIHTWDKLGFIIYEPTNNPGRAGSVTFPFVPMKMAYDPSTMFGGSLIIDGYAFSGSTSLGSVKARPGSTQPYGASSVVFPKGAYNVFTTAKTDTLELVELAMWKTTTAAPVVSGGKYSRTQDVKIVVSGNSVTMNGVAVSGKPYLRDIEAIYGKPDRTWDSGGGGNRVHTWDKLGIVVYEPSDGRCISTTFPYRSLSANFDPTTWFGGTITVDGRTMPATLDLATVKARPGAGQPYGADSIVFDKGDIHVFTQSKGNGLDLVEISYWQRDKNPAPVNNSNTGGLTASSVRVEVTKSGSVKIQGTEIGSRPMVADFKRIYGEPSRVWDKKGGANRIHIWDSLGIIVYEPYNGKAVSFTMPYKPMNTEFSPKTLFAGRVSLDGRGFYKFNTVGVVKTRENATQPYGADSIVFDLGEVHVFTKAAKPEKETIDLVEVSFWQKK